MEGETITTSTFFLHSQLSSILVLKSELECEQSR